MSDNHTILCDDDRVPFVVPKKIMVVAGHPDDELISCGGTLLKYRKLGSKIIVVVATRGKGGYAKESHKEAIENGTRLSALRGNRQRSCPRRTNKGKIAHQ